MWNVIAQTRWVDGLIGGRFGLNFSLHNRGLCLVDMTIRKAVYRPKVCCIDIATEISVSGSPL